MRPKGAKYLVQYIDVNMYGDLREVSASSLAEANEIAAKKELEGITGIRIIKSDDIRMPKRSRKERS